MKNIRSLSITAGMLLSVLCLDCFSAATDTSLAKFYSVGDDGAVNPGRFPYQEGITVTNAINKAGGFNRYARKDKVEIGPTGLLTNIEVNVFEIEKGRAADIKIQPDDYIRVRAGSIVVLRKDFSQIDPGATQMSADLETQKSGFASRSRLGLPGLERAERIGAEKINRQREQWTEAQKAQVRARLPAALPSGEH